MTSKKVVDNSPHTIPATSTVTNPVVNPFERFVEERFKIMAMNAEEDRAEAIKQGVTVRLQPGVIRALDAMSKNLDLSRQQLLVQLVETGLHAVIEAYAEGHRPDEREVIYRSLMDEFQVRAEDL